MSFTKEVFINFRIKTRGLFEIVEPALEDGEVFDSSLLKETVNSLIATGKRNFALDLSTLDYIYSDTINALMALNKITLDVSGRLSLLGPQPEVLQILKRAGIHNILRIFDNETELIRTSEEIILQTSSFHLGELKSLAQQEPPQSEFDQLRSEIGSVFGSSTDETIPPPPKTKAIPPSFQDSRFIPAQPPVAASSASSIEQEFDEAFSQFESDDDGIDFNADQYQGIPSQGSNYAPPPPHTASFIPPPPHTSSFIPPPPSTGSFMPPPARGMYNQPAGTQFQNRQFTPQPPVAPVPPPRPVAPQAPTFDTQKPPVRQPSDFMGDRSDQFYTGAPPSSRSTQPLKTLPPDDEPDEFEEEISSRGRTSKIRIPDDSFDESGDDFFEEGKKRSPVPALIIIVILLALGGVGVYFAFNLLSSKPSVDTSVTSVVSPPPTVVDSPQVTATSPAASEETVKESSGSEVAERKPEVKEPPRVVRTTTRPKPESRPSSRPSTPAPAAVENVVVITSTPSGARVTINGDYLGITPFTWDRPVFGPLSVALSKDGYEDDSRVFEFTGGRVREAFTLKKAAIPTPPPVTYSDPEPYTPPPAPKYTPPPPAPKYTPPEPEPMSEPAPPAPVTRSAPVAEPPPVLSTPSGGGGEASIFIASIPPVADVFLDGKLIGKTNVSEIKLPAGTHNLKFVKGVKEISKAITVQPGKNPSQMVRLQ